jgi:hypothetical protein
MNTSLGVCVCVCVGGGEGEGEASALIASVGGKTRAATIKPRRNIVQNSLEGLTSSQINCLDQGWGTCGLKATCGLLGP